MTWQRSVMSAAIILGGFLIFFAISKAGEKLLEVNTANDREDILEASSSEGSSTVEDRSVATSAQMAV